MAHSTLHIQLLEQAEFLAKCNRGGNGSLPPSSLLSEFEMVDPLALPTPVAASQKSGWPNQVDLRRALSSAYYAIFHFLTYVSSEALSVGMQKDVTAQMRRAYAHTDMLNACKTFMTINESYEKAISNGKTFAAQKPYNKLIALPIDDDLMKIIGVFVNLQELRHKADYDMTFLCNRISTLDSINAVQNALDVWKNVENLPNTKVFLASLLLHKTWNRE